MMHHQKRLKNSFPRILSSGSMSSSCVEDKDTRPVSCRVSPIERKFLQININNRATAHSYPDREYAGR